jgi:hypothetical protein
VLVQAFKKTANYIRYHNWFADVLELDLATVDYPSFLTQISSDLKRPARWKSSKARLVAAPKSAPWWINEEKVWEPRPNKGDEAARVKLRPLAYVPLRDQIAATAIMMCLTDEVETLQGDPRLDVRKTANRQRVISYGNRLFCDTVLPAGGGRLRHRWGSGKLYRSFYADYRTFVSRPESVAAEIGQRSDKKTVIVHSDLSKFYDRVLPAVLQAKIEERLAVRDKAFRDLVKRVLDWKWDDRDKATAENIAEFQGFESLAQPRGLVASGFFANVVLLDFDDALRNAFDHPIAQGILLRDAARYVDDLRFVVETPNSLELEQLELACHQWIEETLRNTAPGLTANRDKTRAVAVHDRRRVMIFQSRRMCRIQESVSGGFDAHGGSQLLAALEGLFNTIGQFAGTGENGALWPLNAVPDVRDETVARFVAARYRSTFRSLRPLLEDEIIPPSHSESADDEELGGAAAATLTKDELDRHCQAFGVRLIEEWIRNPGNVRLLRVGLDLFPDATVLESVLGLLKPLVASPNDAGGRRLVALYCLAEIFRAGATENGACTGSRASSAWHRNRAVSGSAARLRTATDGRSLGVFALVLPATNPAVPCRDVPDRSGHSEGP